MNKEMVKKVLFDIFIKYQGIFFLIILIDQITKLIAIKYLVNPVEIFPWLVLKLQINSGVAFSFLEDAPQWISALISIVATVAIEYYLIFKSKKEEVLFNVILICLAAGAFGNGIDRWLAVFGREIVINGVSYSGVVDFIWPTFFANFNVADIFVTLACIAMIVYTIFAKEEKDKHIVKKSEYEYLDKKEQSNEQH